MCTASIDGANCNLCHNPSLLKDKACHLQWPFLRWQLRSGGKKLSTSIITKKRGRLQFYATVSILQCAAFLIVDLLLNRTGGKRTCLCTGIPLKCCILLRILLLGLLPARDAVCTPVFYSYWHMHCHCTSLMGFSVSIPKPAVSVRSKI